MIRRIPVLPALISAIAEYLKDHNLGNRGVEDGGRRKQLVGLIGELTVHHYLFGVYPDLAKRNDGFDGGYDMVYNGEKIDVKTMERKTYVRPDYVNNFYWMQESYDAGIIVFCSYHNVANVVEICGWLPKSELSQRGCYYAAGTTRIRRDGTSFIFRQNNYEIENRRLDDIELLKNRKQ